MNTKRNKIPNNFLWITNLDIKIDEIKARADLQHLSLSFIVDIFGTKQKEFFGQ